MTTRLLHDGNFGLRCAEWAARELGGAPSCAIDLAASIDTSGWEPEDTAIAFLSSASAQPLIELSGALRQKLVWTSTYLYPTSIRIGPLVTRSGACFDCATRRYQSQPGDMGTLRLQKVLLGATASPRFDMVPDSVAAMAAMAALRQLAEPALPGGYIQRLDFLDHTTGEAVALPVHGCACGGPVAAERLGRERFVRLLERDLGA